MDIQFLIKQMLPKDFDLDAAMKQLQAVGAAIKETHARTAELSERMARLESVVGDTAHKVGVILQAQQGNGNG